MTLLDKIQTAIRAFSATSDAPATHVFVPPGEDLPAWLDRVGGVLVVQHYDHRIKHILVAACYTHDQTT